jgi:DNA-binding CsgD family transcriptional regulator
MQQPGNQAGDSLTKRQREVLERLEEGFGVKQIATDLGVSRNAVYQHVERLRRQGALSETYTPSGQPPRRAEVGSVQLAPGLAPRDSGLGRLRALAAAGADPAGRDYAEAIGEAIAAGDAPGLAYELGRLDALGDSEFAADLIESALRRLSVLPSDGAPGS